MEKVISLPSGSLASRHSAIPYRDKIIQNFGKYDRIIIDLKETDIISGSFADECIGILIPIYGWDAVKSKIRLRNGNGQTDKSIAQAIVDRRNEARHSDMNYCIA